MNDLNRDEIAHDAVKEGTNSKSRWVLAGFATISVLAVILAGWALWSDRGKAEDERDVAETETAVVTDQARELRAEVLADCRSGKPTLQEDTCRAALEMGEVIEEVETNDPEVQESETDDPDPDDPDPNDPDPNDPDRPNDPDPNDPDPNDPDSDDPESQDEENQDPESDDPETQDEEFDDPENQDPEIDDPDPNDPDPTDDPDPDDPDPNDQPISPYPFTFDFEWMGITWTCTIDGPDDNQCEAQS